MGKSGKAKMHDCVGCSYEQQGINPMGSSKELDGMQLRFFCPGNEMGLAFTIDFCLPLVKAGPWC